jgi:hypothetical protein
MMADRRISHRRKMMSDSGTERQPLGEPEDPRDDNPTHEPTEDPNITEDPDGTPVENPSGG